VNMSMSMNANHVGNRFTANTNHNNNNSKSNSTAGTVRNTALFTRPSKFDSKRRKQQRNGNHRAGIKSVEWIQQKKERQRSQGKKVKNDSKYSGRSRGPKF